MSNTNLSVEQRVARLEDIEAIKQLKSKYARNLDNGFDADRVAALFTDNGLWSIKGVGGTAQGKDGIRNHCRNLSCSIEWAQHHIASPLVNIASDGIHAEATFYLLCLVTMRGTTNDAQPEAVVLSGKYSDKLVKIAGEWYFDEINGDIEQSSPWTDGWVKSRFVKEAW
jgi:hypothetical protein